MKIHGVNIFMFQSMHRYLPYKINIYYKLFDIVAKKTTMIQGPGPGPVKG